MVCVLGFAGPAAITLLEKIILSAAIVIGVIVDFMFMASGTGGRRLCVVCGKTVVFCARLAGHVAKARLHRMSFAVGQCKKWDSRYLFVLRRSGNGCSRSFRCFRVNITLHCGPRGLFVFWRGVRTLTVFMQQRSRIAVLQAGPRLPKASRFLRADHRRCTRFQIIAPKKPNAYPSAAVTTMRVTAAATSNGFTM